MLFLTHGEENAIYSLAETIDEKMEWNIGIPEYGQFWTPEQKNI
jgi:predicted metal-dependent RNase